MVGRETASESASLVAAMHWSLDLKIQQEGNLVFARDFTSFCKRLVKKPGALHWFGFQFAVAKRPPTEMGMMDPTACKDPASTASSQPPCKDA